MSNEQTTNDETLKHWTAKSLLGLGFETLRGEMRPPWSARNFDGEVTWYCHGRRDPRAHLLERLLLCFGHGCAAEQQVVYDAARCCHPASWVGDVAEDLQAHAVDVGY